MNKVTYAGGFVPPYFFKHCSEADPQNARQWNVCYKQALLAQQAKVQEVAADFIASSVPTNTGLKGRVIVHVHAPSRVGLKDPEVVNLEKNGQLVLTFLSEKFGRNSFDNRGSLIKVYVHCQSSPNNALWKNNNTIHIGDAFDRGFTSLTQDIDILAHEVAHGIVRFTSKFTYEGQSGALDESWADVLGSMVKQYKLGQKAGAADWLIGDALVRDLPRRIQALRSMKNPGHAYAFSSDDKDPQVGHMESYVDTKEDAGGVHINSGIPNKAFHLFAMEFRDNFSWEIAGQVWYRALSYSKPDSSFDDFAKATVKAAHELSESLVQPHIATKLERVWSEVGIDLSPKIEIPSLRRDNVRYEPGMRYKRRTLKPAEVPENRGWLSYFCLPVCN